MSVDISVIIPTYNRRGFLPKAVASCFDGNERLAVEVVVVDDGSTDGTRSWMEGLDDERIRYIRQENSGAQVARNRGMEQAEGRYIKFLDDDDELIPQALTKEIETLEEQNADIGCGHLRVKSPDDQFVFRQEPKPDFISGIFRGSVWTHPHTFLYRATALECCRWDEGIPYHQDTAFAIQVTAQGASEAVVDRPVAFYRNHEGTSISNDRKSQVSPVERAQVQVELIESGIRRLRGSGALEDYHLQAAADGMWRWAHIISGYDLRTFSEVYDRIKAVKSEFTPPRQLELLSGLDWMIGVRGTERVLYPFRRAKRAIQAAKP